jgi:predicted anti-sigma-YlaC factor YlaD
MNCHRAQELFSDFRDRSLAPPLAQDVAAHLTACPECDDLYRAFCDVADALGSMPVPAPRDELTAKLIATPRRTTSRREPTTGTARPARLVAAASWLAVAAVLATVMVVRPPELATDLPRTASRTAVDVYGFALQSYHRAERWLADFNVLRMTVVVAFEDRIDQINERLRDLADAGRRSGEGDDEQSRDFREPDPASRRLS